MQTFQGDQQQELELAILAIREKFLLDLDDRIALFDDLLTLVEVAENSHGPLKQISNEAHRIAGVAKTLGFSELGQMAESIENQVHDALASGNLIRSSIAPIVQRVDAMLDYMDELRTER